MKRSMVGHIHRAEYTEKRVYGRKSVWKREVDEHSLVVESERQVEREVQGYPVCF